MNYYWKSKRAFKRKLKENKEISKEEWDSYAQANCLFSSNTLMFHADVESFEGLKEKFS